MLFGDMLFKEKDIYGIILLLPRQCTLEELSLMILAEFFYSWDLLVEVP